MSTTARRMFELVEPIGVLPYAADDVNETMFALGFTNYWDTYFAGRAAALGMVPAEVVDALFFNFAPGEVARHIPHVWEKTTPENAIASRNLGCANALRRILADHVGTRDFARATELLLKAAVAGNVEGRPMYAALRAQPVPDDLAERMFHAGSLLREHRGDGHITALMAGGVGRLEAHVLYALASDIPARKFGRIHHLPSALLDEVISGMQARGLVTADELLTASGRALHERVESMTDDLAAGPYEALTERELEELCAPLTIYAELLLADQDFG